VFLIDTQYIQKMSDLVTKNNPHSLYPIDDNNIFNMYKKAVSVFWRTEEVDLAKDYEHFITLSKDEQHFIKMVLCFFSTADALVNQNLFQRFTTEIDNIEILSFYAFQSFMECVHCETYGLMIDTLIKDKDEKERCFDAVSNYPCIKRKQSWCDKYTKSDLPLSNRLVAFAIVEGIFFSGAFCSIFWLKAYKRGLMNGLTFSNELISRDEALHTEFAIYLYNKIVGRDANLKMSCEDIHAMMRDAYDIECEFITEALPCKLIGINQESMKQYIQFCIDRLLVQLKYDKMYGVTNPFKFMEMLSIEGKTNFFEKRVGEYSLSDYSREEAFDIENVDF